MDHSHMGHGGTDHGGMDHGDMCNMNMLFTWDTNNLCIVFKSWRVTSTFSLLWSLLAIIAITAGYELIRELSRKYEMKVQREVDALPRQSAADKQAKSKTIKAALYAVQVFYSFFIMLLFMTYNGWIMLAVGVGAFVGYLAFGNGAVTKSAACH